MVLFMQLQGNVCTLPRCVLHTFQTHTAHIAGMSWLHFVHTPRLAERCDSYVSLTAALLQGFALAQMGLVCILNACCTLFRCIWHPIQTCVNVTLELSCTVLQNESVLICLKLDLSKAKSYLCLRKIAVHIGADNSHDYAQNMI